MSGLIWIHIFWHSDGITERTFRKKMVLKEFVCLIWFCYVPVNNLSVFLGWTSTKLGLMCLAHGHNVVTLVRLKPAVLRSRVKDSTDETLCSLGFERDQQTTKNRENFPRGQRLSKLINWTKSISNYRIEHSISNRGGPDLRHWCILQHLIWICTVCLCPIRRNLRGLSQSNMNDIGVRWWQHF